MDISAGQLVVGGVSASLIIAGLVWGMGKFGMPDRFKPIAADLLGLIGGVAAVLLVPPPSGDAAFQTVLLWIGTGVLASGFYSQGRTVADV